MSVTHRPTSGPVLSPPNGVVDSYPEALLRAKS